MVETVDTRLSSVSIELCLLPFCPPWKEPCFSNDMIHLGKGPSIKESEVVNEIVAGIDQRSRAIFRRHVASKGLTDIIELPEGF